MADKRAQATRYLNPTFNVDTRFWLVKDRSRTKIGALVASGALINPRQRYAEPVAFRYPPANPSADNPSNPTMNPASAQTLRELLRMQAVAALGTLHKGQPYVSMVPFALLPDGSGFVIHVSQLAAHTKDMLLSPPVSLLVVAPPTPEVPAQALARVTIRGRAAQYANGTEGHAVAKAAYLSRFPQSAELFGFADFSLFAILPDSIRFVGGFAQATTFSPETLVDVLGEG